MTIDNFKQILDLMYFKPSLPEIQNGYFYFLQILRRHKENPEMSSNNELIKSFYVKDSNDLIRIKNIIITYCKLHNARAYIRMNRRSYKQCALTALAQIATSVATGNYNIRKCYESAIGKCNAEKDKTWVVDIDGEIYDPKIETLIIKLLEEAKRPLLFDTIPTRNGVHFLTRPFNLQKFHAVYPKIDVLKDNPTILYIP